MYTFRIAFGLLLLAVTDKRLLEVLYSASVIVIVSIDDCVFVGVEVNVGKGVPVTVGVEVGVGSEVRVAVGVDVGGGVLPESCKA